MSAVKRGDKSAVIAVIVLFLFGCQGSPDQQVAALAAGFQQDYRDIMLNKGGSATEPAFFIPDKNKLQLLEKMITKYQSRTTYIDSLGLTANGKNRYKKLQSDLQKLTWLYEGYRSRSSGYYLLPVFKQITEDRQLSPDKKAKQLAMVLRNTNAYFQSAVNNLKSVSAADYEKAVQMNSKTVNYLQNTVPDSISKWQLHPETEAALLLQRQQNIPVIKNYIAWCESNRVAFFKHHF